MFMPRNGAWAGAIAMHVPGREGENSPCCSKGNEY